ncbi:hypothetical protein LQG66_36805 [Bradyrhizobium ontarionense]|uniref:DUF4440 domain-containing protein n=1 Tax=Bradyrhizobium ontarionense TaxID=2898149 RepID=A0ABY3RBP3_9BRAD|nr:hypothetical protein [Bradyrhizobium sp. A19]UFZ04678.1 hypothetical protein LQG66_36805 [Bradyrhizobium sp. A19]
MYKTLFVTLTALALSTGAVASAPAVGKEPLDAATLRGIELKFRRLMELANDHDFKALHDMFWQSPSTLLVAKSAIQSEGNWAGFWGNEAVDQKLHDIGSSGPVVLEPDYSKLKVVGLTRDVAESYVSMNITVSYAGQDGTARPFLMIINWLRIGNDWKVASEIILPVPPAPAAKGSRGTRARLRHEPDIASNPEG